ncbi:hypothetical protein EDC04DRAFT_2191826 [Pisolithus marmoratus]|nr:hypothetical protein EDC04DRAFT_2191826 [Pisolithus marmoratus]
MNATSYCRGAKGTCDCEQFRPSTRDAAHCLECSHGISKHPDTAHNRLSSSSTNATMNIKDVFRSIVDHDDPRSTRNLPSDGQSAAREEAVATLSQTRRADSRKLAKGPAPGVGLQINKLMGPSTSSTLFSVSSVGILVSGIDANGKLRVQGIPNGKNGQIYIQNMQNRGCYLDKVYTIDSTWSFKKVTSQLREWFPKVFQYLEDKERQRPHRATGSAEAAAQPLWRLLSLSRGTFSIVEYAEPDGSHLLIHKGHNKSSVADSHLWFVTRSRVPVEIYESWNTQPTIVGSDSDLDGENSVLVLSDTDSNDSDVNNKLSSSMVGLELDKVSPPVTPPGNQLAGGRGKLSFPSLKWCKF